MLALYPSNLSTSCPFIVLGRDGSRLQLITPIILKNGKAHILEVDPLLRADNHFYVTVEERRFDDYIDQNPRNYYELDPVRGVEEPDRQPDAF